MNAPFIPPNKRKRNYEVELPTLHEDQIKAWEFSLQNRFSAIRCGRRWGKTALGMVVGGDRALKRQYIGWFAPSYRLLTETFTDLSVMLKPVVTSQSKPILLRLIGGGRIDFWSLENESAGRGRKYHLVIIDEAAFSKANMLDIWRKAIRPTLLDYGGRCIVCSNTNGVDDENFLWQICNQEEHGFKDYHAPTHNNPLLPLRMYGETDEEWQARRKEELDKLEKENHPLVYRQEYLAEFVDWSGVAFFERDRMLVDNGKGTFKPVEAVIKCDSVFAVIDTAVKTGSDNDGTAVIYFAYNRSSVGYPLVMLDWDIKQIEGADLEKWLPSVVQHLNVLAKQVNARQGSMGVWIEDKGSGTILIQQAQKRDWLASAIDTKLTSVGKDERAINVSGYVYQGKVKFSKHAYDKTVNYKNVTRNHLMSQVVGFRIGDKDHAKRADDLLDCFCYAISIALGNSHGF